MTDKELFEQLVKKGLLTEDYAERLQKDAELSKSSAEDLLYKRHLVDDSAVARVKSDLLKVPYKKIDTSAIPRELLNLIPFETSQTYRVIPLERRDNIIVVGMLNPFDVRAQEALRFIAKREGVSLGVYLVTPSDLAEVWRLYSPYQSEIENAVKELNIRGEEENSYTSIDSGAKSAEDAPIIKIVSSTLKRAVEVGASDVHIEPQRSRLRIRFRLHGELEETAVLPNTLSQPVISRVKVLARMRLDESRMPQDGRFRTLIGERDIDFRVSTFPTPSGEKVAIRVLDPKTGLRGLKEIGFSDYAYNLVRESISAPYGMILVSGPTGSGKSTTLYSMLHEMNGLDVNIVSLEDPVEYFMEGVNQSQVMPEIGYTFASGLRQILRQDPDVIMVGEIRDAETANLAVNAALTGHRMLSTIHTNNALGVIPRLIDLGVPTFLLPPALNLIIAQRLVLRLCDLCSIQTVASGKIEKVIEENLSSLPEPVRSELKFQKPFTVKNTGNKSDCKQCGGKGVVGRMAIMEVLKVTKGLADVIAGEFSESKLLAAALGQGIVTLRQDGIIKSLQGFVSVEEVLKETEE